MYNIHKQKEIPSRFKQSAVDDEANVRIFSNHSEAWVSPNSYDFPQMEYLRQKS